MRSPTPLFPIIVAKLLGGGGGGGGSVTAAAVLSAMQAMSNAQAAAALAAIDGEPEKLTVTITKTGNQYSADKTYAEITAAVTAGKIVQAVYGKTEVFLAKAEASADIHFFSIVPKNSIDFTKGFTLTLYALADNESMTVASIDYQPITVDAALSSSSTNPVQNKVIDAALALKADASALNNKADKPTVVTDLSSTSITLASAADNTIYEYGELSALTVTAITATGDFIIRFTSGATPTTTNFPATMKFPEAFSAEANTRYEINCSNGYALVTGWPTT